MLVKPPQQATELSTIPHIRSPASRHMLLRGFLGGWGGTLKKSNFRE